MRRHKILWKYCQLGVVALSVLTFTPLVIPENTFRPELFGLPYTLWVGMLLSICFALLIFIGITVHPKANKKEEEI